MKKTTEILATILLTLMVMTQLGIMAYAQGNTNTGIVAFASGDGTEGNPILISTAEELAAFAVQVNNGLIETLYGKSFIYVKLTADIDLSGYRSDGGWAPIGTAENPFIGFFDGDGCVISGMVINRESESIQGLFGLVSNGSNIINLGVTDVDIAAQTNVGSIVGYLRNSNMANCYSSGVIRNSSQSVGGIVGIVLADSDTETMVTNCYSSVINDTWGRFSGGLIGAIAAENNANFILSNSYSIGSVKGSYDVGGLAGSVSTNSGAVQIRNCAALNRSLESVGRAGFISGTMEGTYENNITISETSISRSDIGFDGTSKNPSEINSEGFFESLFQNDLRWEYSTGKLPLLFVSGTQSLINGQGNGDIWFNPPSKLEQSNFTIETLHFTDSFFYGYTGKSVLASGGSGSGAISYVSDDDSIVSVDQNGVLEAHKVGIVTITAIKAGDDTYNSASASITVTIDKRPINISAVSLEEKVFDGTKTGKVTSIFMSVIDDYLVLDVDLTATVEYDTANAGDNKTATVIAYLNSTEKANNFDLTVNSFQLTNQTIFKAIGGDVSVPILSANTSNSITVNPVTDINGTGQLIEYAISQTSGIEPVSNWQTNTSFTGLLPNTTYYVYARTQANENYETGAAQQSVAILTATSEAETYPVFFAITSQSGQLSVTVDGVSILSGSNVEKGKDIVFTATPDPGYYTALWTDNTIVVNELNDTYAIHNISDSHVVTIKFDVKTYNVTVISEGENAYGSGISPFMNMVHISAGTPPANKRFSHWETSSNGVILSSSVTPEANFLMPYNDVTITAVFEDIPPTFTGVVINPSTANVQKGETITFNAVVQGENNPNQSVIWSVLGGVPGTSITTGGALTVSLNETSTTLTVKAVSTADSSIFGTATVNVTEVTPITPTVTAVTVMPNTITLEKDGVYTFTATVNGTNNPPQSVIWSLSGGSFGTSIDSNGILTVGADETANTLIVRATSTFDNSKFGTATVVIPQITLTNAQTPIITANPQSVAVYVGNSVNLSVVANVADGGILSYQWYRNSTNSNIGGTPISGATNSIYSHSTLTTGTWYYYAIITNTNANATGNKTVVITSNVASVTVSYYSGGNNGGNTGGNSGGSNNTPEPDTKPEVTDGIQAAIKINGQSATAILKPTGTLEIVYSEADVKKYAHSNGEYRIEITKQSNILLSIPISALGSDTLVVKTDFGTISIPNKTLQALKKQYGNTLRLVVKKGSFIVAFLNSSNKEIAYNDSQNPFKITLPYVLRNGQQACSVIAVKKKGNDSIIIPSAIYKNSELSFTTASAGSYDVFYNDRAFNDTKNHSATRIISFVSSRGLFSGVGNDNFAPDETMTRAMFVTVLARLEGVDLSQYKTSRFSDVAVGDWYSAAIEWAADKGIVNGVGNGKFNPNAPITVEQMAVVLDNYIKYKSYELIASSSKPTLAENNQVSSWAKESLISVHTLGIITVSSTFDPQGTFTRTDGATIFVKFIEVYNR